jgi:type IV pilus assembly protein PilW
MKPHLRRATGHTLLELTIAVALGLAVTVGAVSLYSAQRVAYGRAGDASTIHDAGVTALTLIGQQIQMAGFVPADPVLTGAGGSDLAPPLVGCSAARPVAAGDDIVCKALSGQSDGIAVRYVGDIVSTWPSATGQPTDCLGQTSGSSAAEPSAGVLIVNRYHATPSESTGEPELYCGGTGNARSSQPLVQGVERLRIRYWLAGGQSAVDASAIAPGQWHSVVAVDLCVLVRGAPSGRRTRYTDCDGLTRVGADMRARQAFWRRVALRNNESGSNGGVPGNEGAAV